MGTPHGVGFIEYIQSIFWNKNKKEIYALVNPSLTKVCFVVCDNDFSQLFYNCSNVEEIFSWHK